MKTIADRITQIKSELDELESHVNSTLSVLDCVSLPLNEHTNKYKEWEWRTYSMYGADNWTVRYDSEEATLSALEKLKIEFDNIHENNKDIMDKNTKTFEKICEFFEKIGLSKTSYASSGKGKKYRTYTVASQWVEQLKRKYPMKDDKYEDFIRWYETQKKDINSLFRKRREEQSKRDAEREKKQQEEREERLRNEERNKAINMAVELLIAYGKKENIDFTRDNAIDKACEVKIKIVQGEFKPTEEQIEQIKKIEIENATQLLELDE